MDNIKNLMKRYDFRQDIQTPSYIFYTDILKKKIDMIRKCLGDNIGLCYAMKANPFIVRYMDKFVDRLEVCSYGEYQICSNYNISPDKIIVSGVNKSKESITSILEYSKGKGIYTIESYKHLHILDKCAKDKGYVLDVIVRLTSGNQFGVDSDTLECIVEDIISNKNLRLVGIHYYSGTQKKIKKIVKELTWLDEYAKILKEKYSIDDLELEYGPGLLVRYFQDDKEVDDIQQLESLNEIIVGMSQFGKTTLEFGRFITASCGYYCTQINDIKNGNIIVDGGIHQVNYYGQIMGMKKPYVYRITKDNLVDSIESTDNYDRWNICGSLCTVNDVIVRDIPIENPSENDILVFADVGAYSATEGIALFLSRELPAIYIVLEDGKLVNAREIVETYRMNI